MYKLANIILLTSVMINLLVGGGIIFNRIPVNSPIIAPLTVMSLFSITIGASLKKKYKDIK